MSIEFYRESPGKSDSRTLSRKSLNRWTGRIVLLLFVNHNIIRIYAIIRSNIIMKIWIILWFTNSTTTNNRPGTTTTGACSPTCWGFLTRLYVLCYVSYIYIYIYILRALFITIIIIVIVIVIVTIIIIIIIIIIICTRHSLLRPAEGEQRPRRAAFKTSEM